VYTPPVQQAAPVQQAPVQTTFVQSAPVQQQAYPAAPAQTAPQKAPWDDDIPFNQAPTQQASGAEQQMSRPVRYY